MRQHRGTLLATRLLFNVFFLATSLYCLLAYVPFSYSQFVKDNLVPGLSLFAKLNPYLYWVALSAGVVSIASDLREGPGRHLARAFVGVSFAAGALLVWHPVVSGAGPAAGSLAASVAALLPVLWLAAVDHVACGRRVAWSGDAADGDRRAFLAAVKTAPFLSLLYVGIASARMLREGAAGLGPAGLLVALSFSLALHFALCLIAVVLFDLVRSVSRLFERPARGEFWLASGLAVALGAVAFLKIVLVPITFGGALGLFLALVFALALVGALTGLAVRLESASGAPAGSGIAVLVAPLTIAPARSWLAPVFWVTGLAGVAAWLALATAAMDWNYLLQKVCVLLIWLLAFAAFYAMSARGARARRELPAAVLLAALLPVAGYRALDASKLWWHGSGAVLDRYTGYDVSLKLLYDFVAVPTSVADTTLYSYLQRNTNIPQDVPVQPVSVDLVPQLTATPGPKPDIFVIVIDSLRRDYLSPYNPKVTFTPSIASFAGESHVFGNAFTHYGATGMSEPSIWAGGMLVHKQYVTPFAPMNALAKLLDAERYQNFLSRDAILRVVVPPTLETIDLDATVANKDLDLCRSLGVLEQQLDGQKDGARPVFAYTQPQNVHVSRITREGASVPAGESYPGFYAPYASRVRHVDQCLGQFVQYLKDHGRYDRSIIVLTSDHGDSLGESGRWGHAYTIYPEIVRIPLIMHVPPALRSRLPADRNAIAFSTDITPTLYALTGHPPTATSPVLGRSLLSGAEGTHGDWQLLASSYGPVYGTLHGNGRWLYIVDAVNYQDYYYDLERDPEGAKNIVTPDVRAEQQAHVREGVGNINRFYKRPND